MEQRWSPKAEPLENVLMVYAHHVVVMVTAPMLEVKADRVNCRLTVLQTGSGRREKKIHQIAVVEERRQKARGTGIS